MHSAPSVSYPVGRSAFAGVVLLSLWLLGGAAVGLWGWQAPVPPGWLALATLLLVSVGAVAAWGWRRSPVGMVSWDGEGWNCSALELGAPAAAKVVLDLQGRMLVRLGAGACWLWLERARCPERWADLRRAVYSRAVPSGLPTSPSANP